MTNPTQKDLWKANLLEFFHNYFIGISHLECSNPQCPLALIWDQIEEKLSKKGKCAVIKIDSTKFLVVDILNYEINGLEELVNVSIQYRDGKQALVRSKAEEEELTKSLTSEERAKLSFLKPSEVVYFLNNSTLTANLLNAEEIYLDDLWESKQRIKWDQKASKKKIINWVEQKPDPEDKSYKIDEWENDYVFYISNPDITNEIKTHEVYSAPNTKEREQLWADYQKDFSELRRVFGIRHLTSKKEDRQNNPEIELNEAQFIALERRKKRVREEGISDWETKQFCLGKHTLTYGAWQERQEAEVEKAEEVQESVQESQEDNTIQELEQKLAELSQKKKEGGE